MIRAFLSIYFCVIKKEKVVSNHLFAISKAHICIVYTMNFESITKKSPTSRTIFEDCSLYDSKASIFLLFFLHLSRFHLPLKSLSQLRSLFF